MLGLPRQFSRLALLAALWLPATVTSAVYRLPIVPGLRTDSRPVQPFPERKTFRIWNQFGEGHFNAHVIELESDGNGRWKRVGSERIDLLRGLRVQSADEACHLLLANSMMKRIDHLAFGDMGGKDYFPAESDAYSHHMETAHGLRPEQMVYFESATWLAAAEAKAIFGGLLPWDRITEVRAPDGLTIDQVRKAADDGTSGVEVRIRRATLRLVAGQGMLSVPPGSAAPSPFFHSPLPWEEDPALRGRFSVERHRYPFVFELGRASQMPGLYREAEALVALATAVALHHVGISQTYPHGEPLPPDAVGIYALSLDRGHTLLFKRQLGMKVVNEGEDHSVLLVSLEDLMRKQPLEAMLAAVADIRSAAPGRYSETSALRLLQRYRTTFRLDLDLSLRDGDRRLNGSINGPIIVRDYTPGFRQRLRAQIAPAWRPIDPTQLEALEAALDRQGQPVSPHSPFYFRDDHGHRDWKSLFGIEPLVVSNLDGSMARADDDYAAKVLLALAALWAPDRSPPGVDAATKVVVTTKLEPVVAQLTKLGLERKAPDVFVTTLGDLHTLATRHPNLASAAILQVGYWSRYHTLADLPGL